MYYDLYNSFASIHIGSIWIACCLHSVCGICLAGEIHFWISALQQQQQKNNNKATTNNNQCVNLGNQLDQLFALVAVITQK